MFTPNQSGVAATRDIVVRGVLNLLSHYWEIGIRNSDHITYTTLLQAVVPGHGGGQVQNRFIGEACRIWENVYETPITELAPKLPTLQTRGEWHSDLVVA